ncbi:MAG: acetylglutamate/acetylaminoadipate kinase [Halobacteria archaeon]
MFVVKIGGTSGVDTENVLEDLSETDEEFVVVHGGSGEVDRISNELDRPPRYVRSPSGIESRYTDEDAMEVFKMAMPGLINTDLVEGLQDRDVDAVGLSGVDGRLLEGKRKDTLIVQEDDKKKVLRGDHSGKIENVNTELLNLHLDAGYSPVVGVPMVSYEGTAVNADADRAAAAIAGALECKLVMLSDVPGVLRDPDDPDTVIESVGYGEIEDVMDEYAEGKMKKKVLASREALDSGATEAVVASANRDEPVSAALSGDGTVFGGDGE